MSQPGALHVRRRRLLLAALVVGALFLLGRGFQLQVVQAATWKERATRQQRDPVALPAERGTLYDRNGVPLATTREMVRVAVAPREVTDRAAVIAGLREALGVSRSRARAAVDPSRRWVVLSGRHDPTVRTSLRGLDGVYLERVLERFSPHGDLALHLLGRVSADGRALGGLELELDSLLRGEDGTAVVRHDAQGDPLPGALVPVRKPEPGQDVYLTLDLGLQEIAEEALRAAVADHDAVGGDLIFADPRTGEVLAAASHHADGSGHWKGVTDAYEPGSTMKPFVMAGLVDRGLVSMEDSVFAEEGRLRLGARTISDVQGRGWITAREVLRYSSNVGMVKLARRLDPVEQYATLRDFGFGTPTGVVYPSESGGRLTRPDDWSGYSQASLAMGYELSVTPLQMTMAYGALANGGRLMEPRLVREVRGADGAVLERVGPRAVRSVISAEAAAAIAVALADVVEEGTGQNANLGDFRVAGKTGTAWVFDEGGYRSGTYTASFAGFFPAREPQLVFLVKLDRGSEHGGAVAAPVTRATLAAALAARNTPLDRRAVAMSLPSTTPLGLPGAASAPGATSWRHPGPGSFVFRVSAGPPRSVAVSRRSAPVPDVRGESGRDAAAVLHAAGYEVGVDGVGRVQAMIPTAGSVAERGSVVRLRLGRSR